MSNWREQTVETLRALILAADDRIVEDRKWREAANPEGVPVFSLEGREICTVDTYSHKIEVAFTDGASLPDPRGLFNSNDAPGTSRAIDIAETDQLDPEAFIALLHAAVDRL